MPGGLSARRTVAATRKRIRMLIPLWGEAYYRKWLELPAASLLASGNLPHLRARTEFELVFLCKAQDQGFLASHPTLRALAAQVAVKTVTIDEFFPARGSVSYGVPLTLAYAKGIGDLGEDGLGTYVILMNADFVLSNGSLAHLLALIDEGCHIVTAPSIRVVEHTAREAFRDLLTRHGAELGFAARRMMSQIMRHLHLTVSARVLNRPHPVDAWHYHELFWQVSPSCLAARYFLMMPFCFQVRRRIDRVLCPVDYGLIQECCPGGRYTVAGDSDDLLIMELQHRDSESDLLDLSPDFRTSDEALAYRVARIAGNAARWTTSEHRRAFAHDLLFHCDDLPPDIDDRLAGFREQMSRISARLPPPASSVRHFHWLGALHHYRGIMHESGLSTCPALIDDEANRRFVALAELGRSATQSLPDQLPGPPGGVPPPALAGMMSRASVVVTLDVLAHEAKSLRPEARILAAALDEAHSLDMATTFLLPEDQPLGRDTRSAFYLLIDSIPHWPKFQAACDAILGAGGEAVLVFRDTNWMPGTLAARSWILSQLHYHFPARDYDAQLDLIADSAATESALQQPCLGFSMRLTLRPAAEAEGRAAASVVSSRASRTGSVVTSPSVRAERRFP